MTSKNGVLNNFIWRFLERCGSQLVAFAVSVVLARLLDPKVYGTVALVMVFTTILQVFVDSGVGTALVQKKEADDLDFSSVFFFNLGLCLLLYAGMFFCAPLISSFYGVPELTEIIRVLSLTIIISGVKNVQQAYVSRNMMFKRFFFAALGGTIGAAVLGIWMAYRGYGVWALVAQHLFNTAVDTAILWITVKWRPKRVFSWSRLKGLFSYGWKLLVSGLMDSVYNEIRQLIIGKLYTTQDLAYYNRGKQFPFLIINNINTSIDSVLWPSLAKEQDDKSRVRSMTRRAIKTGVYVIAPLMIGLAVVAEPLIKLLLTEKWLYCVPFLRVFCISYMFFPVQTTSMNAIKAIGRSDLFLKLEIIKKILGVAILLCTMWHGVEILAYGLLLTSIVNLVVNSWPTRKLLDYRYIDQVKDILPGILLAMFMGGAVYFVSLLPLDSIFVLLIQIVLGAVIYIGGSMLLRLEVYEYLIRQLRNFL